MLKKRLKNLLLQQREQQGHPPKGIANSHHPINRLYRKLSSKMLSLAVKPKLFGEIPDLDTQNGEVSVINYTTPNSEQARLDDKAAQPLTLSEQSSITDKATDTNHKILTFYVLKDYSRSNSILIDLQTQKLGFSPALIPVEDTQHGINENAAIIFLHHRNEEGTNISPRLARLIAASKQHPKLHIQLVPVSILWGRAPDKEDSLFRLLMADNWAEPSVAKQLFNIGVMGRDTFIQFHQPQPLRAFLESDYLQSGYLESGYASKDKEHDLISNDLINGDLTDSNLTDNDLTNSSADTKLSKPSSTELVPIDVANKSLVLSVQQQLEGFLNSQRASMLGPDLSDKRNLVDKLVFSPAIKHACQQETEEHAITEQEALKRARGYAYEIVNDYSYSVIRFFYNFLTWLWTQLYDGVEVHHFERVRKLATDYELVYVPCHRSHIDYLLLSYVIYTHGLSIPYVAAGNNLDVPVVGPILRNAVAFYIRRSFKDNALYTAVLKEYLHTLILRSTPIEYFIEGGRSRSGRLLPPKLGMLAMTVHSQLRRTNKPVVFIPTYIGYERIMEGGTYISELKGKPKESESLLGLLKVSRKIERIFGHVHVSFGTPLHLTDFMTKYKVEANSLPPDRTDTPFDSDSKAMIGNLGIKIMQQINKAAVVNPISLLSLVLLSTPRAALDEQRCRAQIALYQALITNMPYDVDTTVTDMIPQDIINYGIKLKLIERTPHVLGDIIQIANKQQATLSYFRNNILHVFILTSFIAALVMTNGRISRSRLQNIITQLYPFLQSELFLYYPARSIEDTINQKLNNVIAHDLVIDLGTAQLAAPEKNTAKYQQLKVLANPVEQSLERYFMTLALLAQQGSGNLTAQQVVDLCHLLGQRLSVLYADDIPDFFDPALFKSFVETLIRLDYLQPEDDTGLLHFDQRINDIALNAKYILSIDVMQIVQHVADLTPEEIERTITEINEKRQRRFRRRR